MPLVIQRPYNYDPANALTLEVTGAVRFYDNNTAVIPIDINTAINDWTGDDLEKTFWVEAMTPSTKLRDIVLELQYPGAIPDKVSATAVWATKTAVEHEKKTAAQVLADYPHLVGPHTQVKNMMTGNGGVGLQTPGAQIVNGILIEYTMTPAGIYRYNNEVNFDVTRRMDVDYATKDAAGNIIDPANDQSYTHHFPFPDTHPDAANDDPQWVSDESHDVDEKDRMYVFDPPGYSDKITFAGVPEIGHRTFVGHFEEFIRVNIGTTLFRPEGGSVDAVMGTQSPVVEGSRASAKFEWKATHTLESNGTKLIRTTGNDTESAANNIGEE